MIKTFASGWFAHWPRLARQLWRAEVSDARCFSISRGVTLELIGELVASAECLEIQFSVHWPVLWKVKKRMIGIRWVPGSGHRSTGVHRPIPYELKQFSSHHTTDVCLRICGPLMPYRETLDLELVDGPEQRPLAHFKFRLLHRAAVESRLLQSLKARNSRLWVQNRTGCRPAQVVGATSGFLVAEFLVPPADWSAFAPPVETILKVELVSPRGRVEIERQPITLTSKAFTFRTPKLALGDQDLFPEPGNYRLTVSLGPQVVAVLPFEFIGQREMLHRIKVPQISISAQTRAGDLVPGLTTLRWEEHRAVLASMQISSDISAPDTLVNCNASISEGGMVIRNEDIVFPLDRPSRTIKLHPLEFGVTGLQTQPKPARLTVAVTVEGEEKASMVVLVLPPERITNFEGQLTFEVKDLPFDEIEYNQIVQRLRLCDDSSPQRGLWGWLQSKILRD